MDANPKPFWNTTLATVTALGTLIGAVGGLIATVYAMGDTDSGGAASTPTPAASAAVTAVPSSTPAETVTLTPRPSATPVVFEITAEADTWWGPPGTSSGDEDDESPSQSEYLVLDWGCSEDSRGNGSKKDCGSGLIAVSFDLSGLADSATVDEAVLTLYAEEGGGAKVYARRAASGWFEEEAAKPECDSGGEAAGVADESEWRWDVASLVQDQLAGEQQDFGFCLVLKEDAGVIFGSREGPASQAPVLTITYR